MGGVWMRVGLTDLSACSHDDFTDIVFLLDHPTGEVAIFVVGNPNPLLLVELCLCGGGTGGLCALRGSWCRHRRRRGWGGRREGNARSGRDGEIDDRGRVRLVPARIWQLRRPNATQSRDPTRLWASVRLSLSLGMGSARFSELAGVQAP